jgi:signal transduction histidine kinase
MSLESVQDEVQRLDHRCTHLTYQLNLAEKELEAEDRRLCSLIAELQRSLHDLEVRVARHVH